MTNFEITKNEATVNLYTDVFKNLLGHRAQVDFNQEFRSGSHCPIFIK